MGPAHKTKTHPLPRTVLTTQATCDYAILSSMQEPSGDLGLYRIDTGQLSDLPARSGVFLIETDGEPYLNKSADLRRRVARLIEPAAGRSRRPHETARAVWYRETGSAFESSLLLWRLHRHYFPDRSEEHTSELQSLRHLV